MKLPLGTVVAALLSGPLAGLPLAGLPLADGPRLAVVQIRSDTLSLVDPTGGSIESRVAVGGGPHEVALSPDGRTAVVADYERGTTLTVVDVATGERRTIELELDGRSFARPHGVAFVPGTTKMVATSEAEEVLLVVDLPTGAVEDAIATGGRLSHMVVVGPDGRRAFVANKDSGDVSVIDLERRALERKVATGAGAQGLALRPGTDELWVANILARSVSVVHASTLEELAEIPCGDYPVRLAFTPDGARVLCVDYQRGSVLVLDASERRVVGEVELARLTETEHAARPLPRGREHLGPSPLPVGIVVVPGGERAFVACTRADRIAVVDLTDLRVERELPVPGSPDGLAWIPARVPARVNTADD